MKTFLPQQGFAFPVDYNHVNPQQKSLHYGLPWIVPEATLELNRLLTGTEIALDLGVGGSTVFYAARTRKVYGVEIDKTGQWEPAVKQAIIDQELDNVELDFFKTEDEVVNHLNKFTYPFDLVSIDTYHPFNRTRFLKTILPMTSPRCIFVLDNYTDGDLFPDNHVEYLNNFLDLYNLPNHTVIDLRYVGWGGGGTRLVIPNG